ncbi:MAG: glycine--tRNA ligase subunit beta [Firmicutes bacterium]|jgi:glycyl-tRNA synthetase beta chain|nr:glycine--tRNA ligase subunit beta [Bacillota bacterium]
MSGDLLVEIGFEEMPAAYLPSAVGQLEERLPRLLDELRLPPRPKEGAAPIRVYATPRRLAFTCAGIPAAQEDRVVEIKGPSAAAAFDAGGGFSRAATGFAAAHGVRPEDLEVRRLACGEYVFAVKREKGKPSSEVLAGAIPGLILSLEFPRVMRWGSGEHAFGRPIRWVLALLDEELLEFELAGVRSGRVTFGHRVLGAGPFEVTRPDEWAVILERSGVIVDQERRREMIARQVEAAAAAEGGVALVDPHLLEQVNYLVEYPTAFSGKFSPEYLGIPADVLVTAMQHHQRYFPVSARGDDPPRLLPAFVAVRNGGNEGLDLVRAGNEAVIRARLADAAFFFEEDQKTGLEDRVELLKGILFQERLGTLYDKTLRLRNLACTIARWAGLGDEETSRVERAALLCKADLTTGMVREFTELQGVMGREYAMRQGEHRDVCLAVGEHYLPTQSGGRIPETVAGSILAIADKLDTLSGYFMIGIAPSGSQDPYGLRRQGSGIVSILAGPMGGSLRFSLGAAVRAALEGYQGGRRVGDLENTACEVLDFLKARLRGHLEEAGVRYDVVDAVLAAGFDDVFDAVRRATALQAFCSEPGFAQMMVGFKRAANLGRNADATEVAPRLLIEEEEKALYHHLEVTSGKARRLLDDEDYAGFFRCMAGLKEPVDKFLDRVLVMCDDEALRRNRLALLSSVAALVGKAADLSKLVAG